MNSFYNIKHMSRIRRSVFPVQRTDISYM